MKKEIILPDYVLYEIFNRYATNRGEDTIYKNTTFFGKIDNFSDYIKYKWNIYCFIHSCENIQCYLYHPLIVSSASSNKTIHLFDDYTEIVPPYDKVIFLHISATKENINYNFDFKCLHYWDILRDFI